MNYRINKGKRNWSDRVQIISRSGVISDCRSLSSGFYANRILNVVFVTLQTQTGGHADEQHKNLDLARKQHLIFSAKNSPRALRWKFVFSTALGRESRFLARRSPVRVVHGAVWDLRRCKLICHAELAPTMSSRMGFRGGMGVGVKGGGGMMGITSVKGSYLVSSLCKGGGGVTRMTGEIDYRLSLR